jgi:glutamyl/glutaminyl-tRNA synthetase
VAGEPARPVLVHLVAELARVVLLDEATAESILQQLRRHFQNTRTWQARQVYWPIRAALTGAVEGPPLAEIMALLGKEQCLQRAAAVLR